jgi:hypothetical protein
MKLLFYSSDDREVVNVQEEFNQAGIPCEVRHPESLKILHEPPCSELWIRNDRDCHRALMLCVQLGVGFARRSPKKTFIDSWSEISTGSAAGSEEEAEGEGQGDGWDSQVHPMERAKRKAA